MFVLGGCGTEGASPNEATAAGVMATYNQFEKAILEGDQGVFCGSISSEYRKKLSAAYERTDTDCGGLFAEVTANEKSSTPAERGTFSGVVIKGETASGILRNQQDGRVVRTKLLLERQGGKWIFVDDKSLDELGPPAPSVAYRAYVRAVSSADGSRACSLMTTSAQSALKDLARQSGASGSSCAKVLPKISLQMFGLPTPQIQSGKVVGEGATLSILQGTGHGDYVLRTVLMRKVDGRWLFDRSRDAHSARAGQTPGTGSLTES
jgi:hypothetical protein